MKILVVDDELGPRMMVVEVLRYKYPDAEITQAVNGVEGRDKFCNGFFDCVITDFEMAGMNGLELLKFIKDNSEKKIPAVMISGWGNSKQLRDSVEKLGFGFLTKPFRFGELYGLLERLLDKK